MWTGGCYFEQPSNGRMGRWSTERRPHPNAERRQRVATKTAKEKVKKKIKIK